MVVDKAELNSLVIKSSHARVLIPELGVDIKPGPAAQGYITTVEGILHRIKEVLDFVCNDEEVNRYECERKLKELQDFIDGKKRFTLIMLDPSGASKIVSKSVSVYPLGPGEFEKEAEYFFKEHV